MDMCKRWEVKVISPSALPLNPQQTGPCNSCTLGSLSANMAIYLFIFNKHNTMSQVLSHVFYKHELIACSFNPVWVVVPLIPLYR